MSAFIDHWKAELRSKVPLVLWLILSAVVAISGPFGSYGSLTLPLRILFWAPLVGIGVLTNSAIRTYITYHKRAFSALDTLLLTTLLVCLVLCPPLYFLTTIVFDDLGSGFVRFVEISFLVASASMGATALRQSIALTAQHETVFNSTAAEEPRLMLRLEPCQRGQLLAISVRDHYVDVFTSAGTASLLMRLGDAITEAAPVEGAQVHRSHWVAWAAISGVERDGIKLFLQLSHGARVPVSKNDRAKLEERGFV